MKILTLLLSCAFITLAQDQCSLVVKVVDPSDRETTATVTLSEGNGRSVTVDNRPGGARFCDLGLSSVSVSVGDPACNQVMVRNVRIAWGKTTTLKLIYDRQPCLVESAPAPWCQFLFRFNNERGEWIPGVSLNLSPAKAQPMRSDSFGRLLVRVNYGEDLHAMATHEGYIQKALNLTCASGGLRREEMVMLSRAK